MRISRITVLEFTKLKPPLQARGLMQISSVVAPLLSEILYCSKLLQHLIRVVGVGVVGGGGGYPGTKFVTGNGRARFGGHHRLLITT